MKKVSVILGVVAAMLMVFSACETEDLVNPVITLSGADTIEIVLNDPAGFTDPGATATDDKDGDLTAQIIKTGTVDVAKIGSYELTYSVSDNAGNQATVKRIVNVVVKQATYTGNWAVVDIVSSTDTSISGTYNYNATITASGVDQTKIMIANFGGFTASFVVNANFAIFGDFTIPSQPLTGSGYTGTISGTGTTTPTGLTLTFNYIVNYTDGQIDTCVATFTKSK